jgi:hypothetical protein
MICLSQRPDLWPCLCSPPPPTPRGIVTFSQRCYTPPSQDVSDGMFELSKKCSKHMQESFCGFKEHALDLAVTACRDPPPEKRTWRVVAQQTDWKKLVQLPLAGLYAVMAFLCLTAFAVIYYPKQYGPLVYDKTKSKLTEWQVADRAEKARSTAEDYLSQTYSAAASSDIAAKIAEKGTAAAAAAGEAFTAASANPVVEQVATKTGEAAAQLRSTLAEKLNELKGAQENTADVANGAAAV